MEAAFIQDLAYAPGARDFVRRFMDGGLTGLLIEEIGLDRDAAARQAREYGSRLEAFLKRMYEVEAERPATFRAYLEMPPTIARGVFFIINTLYSDHPNTFMALFIGIREEIGHGR